MQIFKIEWTNNAQRERLDILKFWKEHNLSDEYSRKIDREIQSLEQILSINPFIGVLRLYKGRKLRTLFPLRKFSLYYIVQGDKVIIVNLISNANLKE